MFHRERKPILITTYSAHLNAVIYRVCQNGSLLDSHCFLNMFIIYKVILHLRSFRILFVGTLVLRGSYVNESKTK